MATIDMQTMRYINLLDKASNVKTRKCFVYNNTIYFAVPKVFVSKAIGPDAINVRRIQESLGKKVKIIKETEEERDFERFLQDVVSPTKFKNIEMKDNIVTITAGSMQNKAGLIGRNRRRFEELKKVLQDLFGFELRIV